MALAQIIADSSDEVNGCHGATVVTALQACDASLNRHIFLVWHDMLGAQSLSVVASLPSLPTPLACNRGTARCWRDDGGWHCWSERAIPHSRYWFTGSDRRCSTWVVGQHSATVVRNTGTAAEPNERFQVTCYLVEVPLWYELLTVRHKFAYSSSINTFSTADSYIFWLYAAFCEPLFVLVAFRRFR